MPTIIYNSYTIDNIIDKFSYHEDEKAINVSCMFLITAATASALITACQSAEDKLTEINKAFTLTFGGSNELVYSHTGNTGFLSRPSLTKTQSPLCTETSRAYNFAINIQLPFTQSGYDQRREASYTVSYAPSRQRTVSFSVLYTASPTSTSAQTNYTTYAKTWAGTILSGLGGTYELVSESMNLEQENKILNASLTYKEILSNQSSALVDEPGLVDLVATYSLNVEQQTGVALTFFKDPVPAMTLSMSYSTAINRDVVSADTGIDDYYINKIRPRLIAHAFSVTGLSAYNRPNYYVIQSENKNINVHSYTLSGSLVVLVPKSSLQVSEVSETLVISEDENIVTDKLWDGQDYSYAVWEMGRIKSLNRIVVISQFNSVPNAPPRIKENVPGDDRSQNTESVLNIGVGFGVTGSSTGQWLLKNSSSRLSAVDLGQNTKVSGLNTARVYTRSISEQYLWIVNKTVYEPNILSVSNNAGNAGGGTITAGSI